jgi:hypothetical protein
MWLYLLNREVYVKKNLHRLHMPMTGQLLNITGIATLIGREAEKKWRGNKTPRLPYLSCMRFRGLCPERRLEVRVHRGDRPDVEVLHQEVENVGGDVGRQGRAEFYVLDPQ